MTDEKYIRQCSFFPLTVRSAQYTNEEWGYMANYGPIQFCAAQGDTPIEALENLKDALGCHMESCIDDFIKEL